MWSSGKRHGHGFEELANGESYTGPWRFGRREGENGVLKYANGNTLQGQFRDGLPNGHSVLTYTNGDVFTGNFKNGFRSGKGRMEQTDGVIFEGEYVNDKREGKGLEIITRTDRNGGLHKKRWGLWHEGEHIRWIGFAKSKFATQEFVKRFELEESTLKERVRAYSSMYAQMVSERLPDLPDGVDPEDPRVMEIVKNILENVGPQAGVAAMKRIENKINNTMNPKMEQIEKDTKLALEKLTRATEIVEEIVKRRNNQHRVVKELEQKIRSLENEIETFFITEDTDSRSRYNRAVNAMKKLTRREWHILKTKPERPSVVEALLRALRLAAMEKFDIRTLLSTSAQNITRNTDTIAFVRSYECKLMDMLDDEFDVYVLFFYVSHPLFPPSKLMQLTDTNLQETRNEERNLKKY